MVISLIAAVSENNVIGKGGKLPWHLPADMKYFKNTTWALPVIMGRKTFESFPKALQGRTNIVVTRQADYSAQNVMIAGNVDEAIEKATTLKTEEIFVIGGGEIYKKVWDMANRLYITRVHTIVDGDAFFPEMNEQQWQLISKKDFKKDDKHAFDYSFEIWERKTNVQISKSANSSMNTKYNDETGSI